MNAKKSIEALQMFTTGLTNGAFAHLVQGKHFEAMGFSKLAEKYIGHYDEEEDLYWSRGQVEMIEMIGRENWLVKQL